MNKLYNRFFVDIKKISNYYLSDSFRKETNLYLREINMINRDYDFMQPFSSYLEKAEDIYVKKVFDIIDSARNKEFSNWRFDLKTLSSFLQNYEEKEVFKKTLDTLLLRKNKSKIERGIFREGMDMLINSYESHKYTTTDDIILLNLKIKNVGETDWKVDIERLKYAPFNDNYWKTNNFDKIISFIKEKNDPYIFLTILFNTNFSKEEYEKLLTFISSHDNYNSDTWVTIKRIILYSIYKEDSYEKHILPEEAILPYFGKIFNFYLFCKNDKLLDINEDDVIKQYSTLIKTSEPNNEFKILNFMYTSNYIPYLRDYFPETSEDFLNKYYYNFLYNNLSDIIDKENPAYKKIYIGIQICRLLKNYKLKSESAKKIFLQSQECYSNFIRGISNISEKKKLGLDIVFNVESFDNNFFMDNTRMSALCFMMENDIILDKGISWISNNLNLDIKNENIHTILKNLEAIILDSAYFKNRLLLQFAKGVFSHIVNKVEDEDKKYMFIKKYIILASTCMDDKTIYRIINNKILSLVDIKSIDIFRHYLGNSCIVEDHQYLDNIPFLFYNMFVNINQDEKTLIEMFNKLITPSIESNTLFPLDLILEDSRYVNLNILNKIKENTRKISTIVRNTYVTNAIGDIININLPKEEILRRMRENNASKVLHKVRFSENSLIKLITSHDYSRDFSKEVFKTQRLSFHCKYFLESIFKDRLMGIDLHYGEKIDVSNKIRI